MVNNAAVAPTSCNDLLFPYLVFSSVLLPFRTTTGLLSYSITFFLSVPSLGSVLVRIFPLLFSTKTRCIY